MILAGIELNERNLVERVIRNIRPCKHPKPRWAVVRDIFGVGSMVAYAMCREFQLDPEEKVNP